MKSTTAVFLPWRFNKLHNLVQIGVFLFFALSLAIPSGYSYGPALLLISSLAVCWRPSNWLSMSKEVKILALVFFCYVFVQALSIWLDGGKLREFDRPSRALMAILILPLLVKYPVRLISLTSGLAVGASISGVVAIYDKFYLGMDRAFGDAMPIQDGNISMTIGLLCLCSFFWYRKNGHKVIAIIMLLSCGMGMLGSLLSGARGGWVLLPVIIGTIIFHYKRSSVRHISCAFLLFFVGVSVVVSIPQTGVLERVKIAQSDIENYISGENKDTSLGIRFQLWASALDAFKNKPVWGWGNNGIREAHKQQLEQGKISEFIYKFDYHAHNQFLDEMAKRGIIGLMALCLVYFYPVSIYFKNKNSSSVEYIMLAVASLTLADYSLSQAFINHNSGVVFFSMMFSILITMSVVSIGEAEV